MRRQRQDFLARVQTLQAELALARRELERVTGQRDELRRVIGNVRSFARQEAESAVAANLERRAAVLPGADRPPWAMHRDYHAVHGGLRPTVASAAHLNDPDPPE